MANKKTMLATIAAILIVSTAIIASLEISQKNAYGQQATILYPSREKTASVIGSATTSIEPDLVTVQFGVDTQSKTAQEATLENAKIMNSVVSAVENIGITKDEISTAGFSIYPVYNDSSYQYGIQKSVLIGYRVSNTLYIKSHDLSLAGNIIDVATGAGANRVDNVFFSLSPEKEQSVRDDLLGKAVSNAKLQAQKLLDPLGQKIIGVKMVSMTDLNEPWPIYNAAGAMPMAEKSTPIFTSNQQVTTTVNVVFLIGDQ